MRACHLVLILVSPFTSVFFHLAASDVTYTSDITMQETGQSNAADTRVAMVALRAWTPPNHIRTTVQSLCARRLRATTHCKEYSAILLLVLTRSGPQTSMSMLRVARAAACQLKLAQGGTHSMTHPPATRKQELDLDLCTQNCKGMGCHYNDYPVTLCTTTLLVGRRLHQHAI